MSSLSFIDDFVWEYAPASSLLTLVLTWIPYWATILLLLVRNLCLYVVVFPPLLPLVRRLACQRCEHALCVVLLSASLCWKPARGSHGHVQRFMEGRSGFKLDLVSAAHNLFLCVWSLVMFVALLLALLKQANASGWHSLFCNTPGIGLSNEIMFWLCA
jgi:hypothetical protein